MTMLIKRHYQSFPEERFKPWQFTDFYLIETFLGTFVVSMGTARYVEHKLATCSELEWIDFHDLSATRQRVQARGIIRVSAYEKPIPQDASRMNRMKNYARSRLRFSPCARLGPSGALAIDR